MKIKMQELDDRGCLEQMDCWTKFCIQNVMCKCGEEFFTQIRDNYDVGEDCIVNCNKCNATLTIIDIYEYYYNNYFKHL